MFPFWLWQALYSFQGSMMDRIASLQTKTSRCRAIFQSEHYIGSARYFIVDAGTVPVLSSLILCRSTRKNTTCHLGELFCFLFCATHSGIGRVDGLCDGIVSAILMSCECYRFIVNNLRNNGLLLALDTTSLCWNLFLSSFGELNFFACA